MRGSNPPTPTIFAEGTDMLWAKFSGYSIPNETMKGVYSAYWIPLKDAVDSPMMVSWEVIIQVVDCLVTTTMYLLPVQNITIAGERRLIGHGTYTSQGPLAPVWTRKLQVYLKSRGLGNVVDIDGNECTLF